MKSLFLLSALSLASVSSAFAGAQPDFTCVAKNGYTYKFFQSYGEIHVTDRQGREVESLDSMSVRYVTLESFPPQDQYSFIHEEGDTVAVLTFFSNEKQGRGKMIGNGQAMTCVRN